ncbi:MAG: IS66 family transposase [Acidobacteriaceae bacterium]
MSTAVRIVELEQQNSQLSEQLATLSADHAMLKRQLDWFKRQLFGAKSEKQLFIDPAVQGNLLATLGVATPPPPPITPTTTVTYARKKRRDNTVTDTGLRFDETVPVNIMIIGDPAIEALPASARECIGEKVTYRLAQRPASYELMKYIRKVYKITATQEIVTTISPPTVLEKCVADVSLLAGIVTDKFLYHLPLYRQHQRINAAGIQVSRGSLTNWSSRAIDLLEPIYAAQFSHVLLSRVLAMDETPIKAGRREKGKLRQCYFWPIYGQDNEVVFPFATSRAHSHVPTFLGSFAGTLLSDGYEAYAAYAKNNTEVTHAECWAHCRRHFEGAREAEPAAVAEALALIGSLYHHEQIIRDRHLEGEQKLAYRTEHSEPITRTFWRWCDEQCYRPDLIPGNPLSKALKYARERRVSLMVFLSNPEVPIDTNHLERALRPIPMGRRNWLFCWTELGAKQVGIIQSLIATCKLHGVDVYTYLVDVLQRVSQHPAKDVIDLTPRVWKTKFAHNPMKSDIAVADQ